MKIKTIITIILITVVTILLTCEIEEDESGTSTGTGAETSTGTSTGTATGNTDTYYRCHTGIACFEYMNLADYQIQEPYDYCAKWNDYPQFSGIIWEENQQCSTNNLIGICTGAQWGVTEKTYYYSTGDWGITNWTNYCASIGGTWEAN